MKLQRLLSYTRKAVEDYDMIHEGDVVCIGVSGGKDSLAMLYALNGLKRFYKHKFTIHAITVKLGFEPFDLSEVQTLCNQLEIPYSIVETDIGKIVFEEREEKNPCSLCAKMRKGALYQKAIELGCNRIALGHHKEDIVETMMMSLFFEGRFYVFPPVTYMEDTNLHIIRPLMYVPETDIKAFKKRYELPVVKSPCPANGHTSRETMKQLLLEQNKKYPGLSDRMYRAIQTSTIVGWEK